MKYFFLLVTGLVNKFKVFRYSYHRALRHFPSDLAIVYNEINGAIIRLDLKEEVDFAIHIDQKYGRQELLFFNNNLSSNGTFLDIGANIGFYSIILAKANPSAHVFAFEPEPLSIAGIETNIKLNFLSNIHVEKYAIYSYSGSVSFRVNESGNRGGSGIDLNVEESGKGLIKVPCKKLSDALNDNNISNVDCMKIDIEGHEYDALSVFFYEAPHNLWPTAIITESFGYSIKSSGGSVIQLLIQQGYDLVDHNDLNFFFLLRKG
jgi:FkbM family methyltransferase